MIPSLYYFYSFTYIKHVFFHISQDINMLHKHKEIAHIRYVRVI